MTSAPVRLPDVAVVLITYNHERFVGEAIKSILRQEYPGNILIIISDDCSTDQTPTVIKESISDMPTNVTAHPLFRDQNVGGLRNLSETWELAQESGGSYIALLEGDDYWTDPRKLALQVSYLERHAQATISFGLASELILRDDAPPLSKVVFFPPNDHPTFGDLLAGNFISTCTVVYRSRVLPRFPGWFAECSFRDWPLHLVHASAGEMHYLDHVVGVHRQHQSSKWFNETKSQQDRIKASEVVQRLAMSNLGTTANYQRAKVSAGRHIWWAGATTSKPKRWAHLLAAAALNPGLIGRKLKRRTKRRR